MSSDRHTVLFSRRLRAVRLAAPTASDPPQPPVVRADQTRLAEEVRRLSEREAELARREQQLADLEAALVEERKILDERSSELASLISSASSQKAAMLEANEEEIVSLSLSITQKVLQYEVENGHYKIGEIVKSALQAVRDRGATVVRVNPRDRGLTEEAVAKLSEGSGRGRITVVSDESIPLASCCIETDSGKAFSEIPGRLKKIEQSWMRTNGDTNGL
jgi:flagellar biosynthesis/type III secretory pathway protein FliH